MPISRFFRRARWDRERLAEIESYVRIETDENIARGMPEGEARAAAQRKFGNSTLVREEIYRMNTIGFADALARDLRHSVRLLRKQPMFSAAALLTLAIGIGANTAVFSVVNSVLLKPLPYPNAEELASLRQTAPGAAGLASFASGLRLSPSMYFTYAGHNRAFRSLGIGISGTANVTGLAEPEQVRTFLVSDGVLQTLGVSPIVGRWLSRADQDPHGPESIMLSYGYWQHHFAGSRTAIGRTLIVDARPRQIVGVMPPGFRIMTSDPDLIVPFAFDRSKLILAGFGYQGIARLKPGVTIAQANADIARMLPIWMDSWSNGPHTNSRFYETWRITPAIRPLKQEVIGNVANVLWVVMATIGIVMLIACANVANLLLVRAEGRQQELAVRAALGASRARIVRELLVESVLLGLLGGALGVALAYGGLRLLAAIGPANLPRLNEISLDARALAFTLALSLLSGLLFGSIPALKYAGPRIALALRSAGRTASVSRERHRSRNLLVIAQVAMGVVLLIGAGLMIRTFDALRKVEPGFADAKHLETIRISIPPSLVVEPQRVTRIQNEIADKLAAIPGVTSVGFASALPMEGVQPNWNMIFAEGHNYKGEIPPLRLFKNVSPGFFHAVGTKLIAGHELTWTDVYQQRRQALVSENLARELWGSPSNAVGKRFREFADLWEVVGVVEYVRENGVDAPAPAIVYWPSMMQDLYGPGKLDAVRGVTFAIRSDRAGTESLLSAMRQAVWSVNPSLPLASVRTMQDIFGESMARTSFTLVMLAIAASMALVLGIVGIYGVISYGVSQRRREIGVRLALGAQQSALKRMFVRSGLALAASGVAIGLLAAAALMRMMKSLLFGISPLDPFTYAAAPLVLAAAAVLASYLPARRAADVDPVEALKSE
jgi:predicted permease